MAFRRIFHTNSPSHKSSCWVKMLCSLSATGTFSRTILSKMSWHRLLLSPLSLPVDFLSQLCFRVKSISYYDQKLCWSVAGMVVKIAPRIFESISQHAFRTHSRLATIFSFTQRQHFPLLIAAHLISCLCGLIKPAISILIGRFFTTFSEIATTTTDTNDVSKRNSINIGLLLALAASTLVIKAAFSSIWEVHAEVQLKVVQQKLFANLLERNLEWFDKQHSDMGSLLIGNQTYVVP